MVQFMQATYQNGQLILKQKLNKTLEGKTVNIIVITEEAMAHKKEHFLEFVDSVTFTFPSDYRFNRDELHAR
jgi:predicted DNA-binding antitoxin AbrB/MazE fold protein